MAQSTGSGTGQIKQLYSYDASGQLVSVNYNGTEYFYLRNGQNDIMGLMDGNGTKVVEYTYDSWGKLISIAGTLATTLGANNPFRYRGYYYDTETGLYYLQTRYYDPEVCRFISADVYMSTGQGIVGNNMFAYCVNNPIVMADHKGESVVICVLGVTLTLAEAIAALLIIAAIVDLLVRDEDSLPARLSEAIINGLRDVANTIVAKLEAAQEKKEYRSPTEEHHIVAQSSPFAYPAQWVMGKVQININSPENIVTLKTGLHRCLHTQVYFGIVNAAMMIAYQSGNSFSEKRGNVQTTLAVIKGVLSEISMLSPY